MQWGYLGKRNDVDETEVVTSPARLLELENADEKEITQLQISDDERHVLVSFKATSEEAGVNGNIVLAALTTAYARIALYHVLRAYQHYVAYFDTDRFPTTTPQQQSPSGIIECFPAAAGRNGASTHILCPGKAQGRNLRGLRT